MAKRDLSGVSASKRLNTPADGEKSQEQASMRDLEHTATFEARYKDVVIKLDDKEYTLQELIDACWTATFERNALAEMVEKSMTAMVRIYGQPPYDDCSLSEYLEIVADGQLDAIRKEFEDGI